MKQNWRTLAALVAAAMLLCLPLLLFNRIPGDDTAGFYSPMIREIGAGRWAHGFFSVTPPLFCLVGGLFAALGLPAFTAAKVASILFFAATAIPLYDLLRRNFQPRAALSGIVLFILCSPLMEYAGEGVLGTGKTFFLVLLVAAVSRFRADPHWRHTVLCAAAAAGLCLIRGEGIIFAGLGLLVMLLAAVRRGQSRADRLLVLARIATAALLCLVLISPWLAYEYRQTGWPVTDAKQVTLIKALFTKKKASGAPDATRIRSRQPRLIQAAGVRHKMANNLFEEVTQGLFFPFLLLAIPGIIIRFRSRAWTLEDSLLIGWILLHSLFFIGFGALTGVIQKRYLVAAIPLYLGWAGLCLVRLWDWAETKAWRKRMLQGLAALAAAGLIWKGTGDARPPRKETKRIEQQAVLEVAAWLNTTGRDQVPDGHPRLQTSSREYHNGRHPVVFSIFAPPVFLAQADWVYLTNRDLRFGWEYLRRKCQSRKVNFILVDRVLAKMCPALTDTEMPNDFVILEDRWAATERPYWIVGYRPNLNLPGVNTDDSNSSEE